jgi:cytochrome b561
MTTSDRYGPVAIALHWSTALLIVLAFGLGLTVDAFPKPWVGGVINAHALLGLAVLALTFFRFFWRLKHPAPAFPATFPPLMKLASHAGHMALYALMVLIPLIGIPTLLYRGRGLDFGLFQIASPFARTKEIFGPLTEVHEIASYALIALAIGHALAAIYHQRVLRDGTLSRMLPAPRQP